MPAFLHFAHSETLAHHALRCFTEPQPLAPAPPASSGNAAGRSPSLQRQSGSWKIRLCGGSPNLAAIRQPYHPPMARKGRSTFSPSPFQRTFGVWCFCRSPPKVTRPNRGTLDLLPPEEYRFLFSSPHYIPGRVLDCFRPPSQTQPIYRSRRRRRNLANLFQIKKALAPPKIFVNGGSHFLPNSLHPGQIFKIGFGYLVHRPKCPQKSPLSDDTHPWNRIQFTLLHSPLHQ